MLLLGINIQTERLEKLANADRILQIHYKYSISLFSTKYNLWPSQSASI
jgi:hypothetical protein